MATTASLAARESVALKRIDSALDQLRNAGLSLPSRPRKVKNDPFMNRVLHFEHLSDILDRLVEMAPPLETEEVLEPEREVSEGDSTDTLEVVDSNPEVTPTDDSEVHVVEDEAVEVVQPQPEVETSTAEDETTEATIVQGSTQHETTAVAVTPEPTTPTTQTRRRTRSR